MRLDGPEPVLRDRLTERWHHYGLSPHEIAAKLEDNDLPNAWNIMDQSQGEDFRLANV